METKITISIIPVKKKRLGKIVLGDLTYVPTGVDRLSVTNDADPVRTLGGTVRTNTRCTTTLKRNKTRNHIKVKRYQISILLQYILSL